eukprot:TRINITY_DN64859_c1_g1_i1.p1 TRINITY_DN64859_c1_g1~~TRINITY_DN64859_c1_g1_i1.p1  ORF type:complete len:431 (+),score=49.07 TRINITY_DN64859_c1_g1_i1:150-1295(+)
MSDNEKETPEPKSPTKPTPTPKKSTGFNPAAFAATAAAALKNAAETTKNATLKGAQTVAKAAGPIANTAKGFMGAGFISHQGWLQQRGTDDADWKAVWVVLDNGFLKVFNSLSRSAGDVPELEFSLVEIKTVKDYEDTTKTHCFMVVRDTTEMDSLNPTTEYMFSAEDDSAFSNWVGLLKGVSTSMQVRGTMGSAAQTVANKTVPLGHQVKGFFVPIKECGRLQHRSGSGDSEVWNDVYVVVDNGQLKIYDCPEDVELMTAPNVMLELAETEKIADLGPDQPKNFLVSIKPKVDSDSFGEPLTHFFQAQTQEDAAKWVALLNGISDARQVKGKIAAGGALVAEKVSAAAEATSTAITTATTSTPKTDAPAPKTEEEEGSHI